MPLRDARPGTLRSHSAFPNSLVLRRLPSVFAVALSFLLAGCKPPAPPPAPPPPPAVTVSRPLAREVVQWDEFIGRLEAVESVEVRARVSGFIDDAPFNEGAVVEKGTLLFVIDPRPLRAELDRAQGQVGFAQSQLQLASTELRRTEKLAPSGAVGELELDTRRANVKQSQAQLASAQAAARTAELNLEFTRVVAPITGRISRKLVTQGNLINGGQGESTLLTTITSIAPIHCYVDADEQRLLKYRCLARQKSRVSARDQAIPCFMGLGDEPGFPHVGHVDFVDNRLDAGTGTLRARGVFPNKDGSLTPGFSVRLRLAGSGKYQTLLVPDAAVGTDQGQKFLTIVRADGIVERRNVRVGAIFGTLRSIEEGIGADDRVVVNGLQKAEPGKPVSATEVPIDPSQFPEGEATGNGGGPTTIPNGMGGAKPTSGPSTAPSTAPSTDPSTLPAATGAGELSALGVTP